MRNTLIIIMLLFGSLDFYAQSADIVTQSFVSSGLKYYTVTFDELPTINEWKNLNAEGLSIVEYLGDKKYILSTKKEVFRSNSEKLKNQVLGINRIAIPKNLHLKELNNKSDFQNNTIKLVIIFRDGVDNASIREILKEEAEKVVDVLAKGKIVVVEIHQNRVFNLPNYLEIAGVELFDDSEVLLNFNSANAVKVNMISDKNISGGLALDGSGVVVGVGDGGKLGKHLDLMQNTFNETDLIPGIYGSHGDHVSGTVASAGIINPLCKGIAPKSDLIIETTSNILRNMEMYVAKYNMVVTNCSWGPGPSESENGKYLSYSTEMDTYANEFENVISVFAAGNYGRFEYLGYPKGYYSVMRGWTSAKNNLVVGNVDLNGDIVTSSSRGPVADGRVKPEICALGKGVYSTGRDYNYFVNSGTSMAAPAISGVLSLMYQRYRQLNGENDPKAALMKSIICNTADDRGNDNVDYTYGFGVVNASRAIKVIEKEQYLEADVESNASYSKTLNVPANLEELKIMLYYHDKAGKKGNIQALINDLDLEIIAPDGTVFLPWVLNNDINKVKDAAVRGVDRLNNIEQVTIKNPQAGNYTMRVKGVELPYGSWKFSLTWDFLEPELLITFPYGGESIASGRKGRIYWDYIGDDDATFSLWRSVNGTDWKLLQENMPASQRMHEYYVTKEVTTNLTYKLVNNKTGETVQTKDKISILPIPRGLKIDNVVSKQIRISWDECEGVEAYDVYVYADNKMNKVVTTKYNSVVISGKFKENQVVWCAVAARKGESVGVRSIAKNVVIKSIKASSKGTHGTIVEKGNIKKTLFGFNSKKSIQSLVVVDELNHTEINNQEIKNLKEFVKEDNKVLLGNANKNADIHFSSSDSKMIGNFGENDLILNIYPNPVKNDLHVDIFVENDMKANIILASVNGEVIFELEEDLFKGENKMLYSFFENLDIGIYILTVQSDHKFFHKMVIKE